MERLVVRWGPILMDPGRKPRIFESAAGFTAPQLSAPVDGRSVAEVPELQGYAEVVVLERRDHRLQVVALLGGDA